MPGVAGAITGAELSQEMQGQKIPVLIPAFDANYRQYWPARGGRGVLARRAAGRCRGGRQVRGRGRGRRRRGRLRAAPRRLGRRGRAAGTVRPWSYADWDGNEIFGASYTGGSEAEAVAENDAAVEALFAEADVVLRQRFRTHRCGVCPIETRGRARDMERGGRAHPSPDDAAPTHRAVGARRPPGAFDRRRSGHRATRSGRGLRRQGALLPRACRGLSPRAQAGAPGALDRDARRAPDDGEPGARPDPRPRNRCGRRRPHPRAPQPRHRRRGRRAPGRLLGLRHALARLRHAAQRLRDPPCRHQAPLRGYQQGVPQPVALVRRAAHALRAGTRPRHAGTQARPRKPPTSSAGT